MSQTEKRLMLQGREFILLGTAHISQESIVQVTTSIREEKPDCVAIELDEQRYASMKNPEAWKNLDIVKVLKNGQGFVLMANLILSSFQKRMGADVGVKPGEEMKAAIAVAEELNIPAVMVDRPIQMTLKRAWAKNSLWGKCKLLAVLLSSAFEKSEISAEEIEKLKNESEMDSMMNEIAEYLPAVKAVLIDERDRYLASHIWEAQVNGAPAKKTVAVLGRQVGGGGQAVDESGQLRAVGGQLAAHMSHVPDEHAGIPGEIATGKVFGGGGGIWFFAEAHHFVAVVGEGCILQLAGAFDIAVAGAGPGGFDADGDESGLSPGQGECILCQRAEGVVIQNERIAGDDNHVGLRVAGGDESYAQGYGWRGIAAGGLGHDVFCGKLGRLAAYLGFLQVVGEDKDVFRRNQTFHALDGLA